MNIRKPVFFLLLVMSVCRSEQIYDDDVVFNGSVSVPTSTVAAQAVNNTRLLSVSNALQSAIDDVVTGATDWGDIGGTLADQTDLQNALDLKANLSALVTESGRIDTAESDIAVMETNAVLKTGGSGITGTMAMTGRLTIGDTNRTGTLGYSTWLPDAGHIYNTLNRDSFLRNAKHSFATGNTNVWDAGLLNNTAYGNGRDYQIYDRLAGTWAIRAVNNGPVLVQPEFIALGGLDGALAATNLTGTIPAARLPDSNAAREALGLSVGTDVVSQVTFDSLAITGAVATGEAAVGVTNGLLTVYAPAGAGGLTEVTAGDVDSEASTDGQVLTSDGAGGAAWEDAGGTSFFQADGGTGSFVPVIGGNAIDAANANYSAILSGQNNSFWSTVFDGSWSVICGGSGNYFRRNTSTVSQYNFIGGGQNNFMYNTEHSVIVGGEANIGPNAIQNHCFLGGGRQNNMSGGAHTEDYKTLVGGYLNAVSSYAGFVGGGQQNTASGSRATVPGGQSNTASGSYATVPGGSGNTASGSYSLAAGYQSTASHTGSMVLSDSTGAAASGADHQMFLAFDGGIRLPEVSAEPATPAANSIVLFAIDDGDGTQSLKVKFDDGTVVILGAN